MFHLITRFIIIFTVNCLHLELYHNPPIIELGQRLFKERYSSRTALFGNKNKQKRMELSQHILEIKQNNIQH